jgi:hypothetical protein
VCVPDALEIKSSGQREEKGYDRKKGIQGNLEHEGGGASTRANTCIKRYLCALGGLADFDVMKSCSPSHNKPQEVVGKQLLSAP